MGRLDVTKDVVSAWGAMRPATDLSALGVIQRLLWCGRLTEDLLERAAQSTGLRHRGDYEVLAILRRSHPSRLTPIEVAEALITSPSGMTGKLDRLENQGLIKRTRDDVDRRAVRLELTDEGRQLADRSFELGLGLYERMLSDLGKGDRESLDEYLSTLLDTLDRLYTLRRPWESE